MLIKKIHTLISLILIFTSVNAVFAKDIKEIVEIETQLDEQIELFCEEYCQGNKKNGYIKSISINKINSTNYRVVGRAALQSKQVYRNYVLYDHTVIINTFGTLDSKSCEIRVDEVFVQNDFNDIFTNLIISQSDIIGKKEVVPGCKKFLD